MQNTDFFSYFSATAHMGSQTEPFCIMKANGLSLQDYVSKINL